MDNKSHHQYLRLLLNDVIQSCEKDLSHGEESGWPDMAISCLKAAKFSAEIGMKNLKKGDIQEAYSLLSTAQISRQDAIRWIERPHVERGIAYSAVQSPKGKKGAEVRWHRNQGIQLADEIIRQLAAKTDELLDPLPGRELWVEFYSRLDEEGLNPRDTSGEIVQDTDRISWEGNSQGITYKTFRNKITIARQN